MSQRKRYECFDQINSYPPEEARATYKVLYRICSNIMTQPKEPKYRRLRINSKVIQQKILPVDGAFNCLLAAGFQEDGEYLTLPESDSLNDLTEIQYQLNNLLKIKPSTESNFTEINFPPISDCSMEESAFYSSLVSTLKNVRSYENPELLQKAQHIIPVIELRQAAEIRCDLLKNAQEEGYRDQIHNFGFEDCLLIGLLDWYKNHFFKWVDSPACTLCQYTEVQRIGTDSPLPEEAKWQTQNVELYKCNLCETVVRFPRYNHPGKLLETREGRCGEWANCFTLCCRAMGFEARFVVSWKDHVWTEVFSKSQDRWMHCDPCENVCDKPLLYELGWGVKINYIIAFSHDDIVDVTWRYSCKHDEVQKNRTKVKEAWLTKSIDSLRRTMQQNLPRQRKDRLMNRLMKELIEFMMPKSADAKGLGGRTTGSLAWRLNRGEIQNHVPYIFKPDNKEQEVMALCVKYSCSEDFYIRPNAQTKGIKDWKSAVFSVKDIIRKEEHDWKMVYLARQEGSDKASISWKFDVSDCNMTIKQLEIYADSMTFSSGNIVWQVQKDKGDTYTLKAGEQSVLDNVRGSKWVTLTAELSGGEGTVAWQHTQLFRQELNTKEFPLQITVYLENE